MVYPPSGEIPQYIAITFKDLGAEAVDWGLRVAKCESGYQPYVSNHTNGKAKGLFQFMPPTFYANAKRAGIKDPDLWNWRHQVHTAKYMYSIGQQKQWECS